MDHNIAKGSTGFGAGPLFVTLGQVEMLQGNNYKKWRDQVEFYLSMRDGMDMCLTEEQPADLTKDATVEDKKYFKDWYSSNRRTKNVIRTTMSETVRGSVMEPELAWDFLEAISEKYLESDKAEIARLSRKFNEMSFSSKGSVREHIMGLIDINSRLRDLNVGVQDEQVVHVALESLPSTYNNIRTSYNTFDTKWNLNKLISVCVDEEERIKKESVPTTTVNLVERTKGKKHFDKMKLKKTTFHKVSGKNEDSKVGKIFKYKCFFCKKTGHMKKNCPGFKAWMIKKGYNKEENTNKE